MRQKIYQVDAFSDKVFSGNPAAVCPLDKWLSTEMMQKIAMENNVAETVFYVKEKDRYEIRWFTPTVEVDLCGHATLAAAFVLFSFGKHPGNMVRFHCSRNGDLTVTKEGQDLTLNFPTDVLEPADMPAEISSAFNIMPHTAYKGKTDYMFVFNSEQDIKNLVPSLNVISKMNARGVIVTAKGEQSDFVSRFFAPQSGINEDPVTGSAHTTLIPYWSQQLGKTELTAIQLSERKGRLQCKHLGERVEISGQCRLYLGGELFL